MTEKGRLLGLVDDVRWKHFDNKRQLIEKEQDRLQHSFVHPGSESATRLKKNLGISLTREYSFAELLKRPK